MTDKIVLGVDDQNYTVDQRDQLVGALEAEGVEVETVGIGGKSVDLPGQILLDMVAHGTADVLVNALLYLTARPRIALRNAIGSVLLHARNSNEPPRLQISAKDGSAYLRVSSKKELEQTLRTAAEIAELMDGRGLFAHASPQSLRIDRSPTGHWHVHADHLPAAYWYDPSTRQLHGRLTPQEVEQVEEFLADNWGELYDETRGAVPELDDTSIIKRFVERHTLAEVDRIAELIEDYLADSDSTYAEKARIVHKVVISSSLHSSDDRVAVQWLAGVAVQLMKEGRRRAH